MKFFTSLPVKNKACDKHPHDNAVLYYGFGCVLSLLFLFTSTTKLLAQTTVPYVEQTSYYDGTGSTPFFVTGTSGAFNANAHQLGLYAHGGEPDQILCWRQFKTAGNVTGGTTRSLQVGDVFTITFSNCQVYGELGFSLLSNPTSRSVWNDRLNNDAVSINLDGPGYTGNGTYGYWYAEYSNGSTANAAASTGSANIAASTTSGTYKNFTIICTLTAPDRMNVTISDGTTTSYLYDILLNTSTPITDYAVYFDNDYDGGANRNAYVSTSSTSDPDNVTNNMSLPLGISNASFTENNVIPDGLAANSVSTTSSNSLIKSGSGTVTLNAVNTYSGTTTISSGTLALGIANAIPANAITLNNGTLSSGTSTGFNDALGVLTLTATSTIALGTGSHSLSFAASNAATWTGTLNITGWVGSAGASGTAGKVIFGSNTSGLTAAQLSQISFSSFGSVGAAILSTGEVVPKFIITSISSLPGSSTTTYAGATVTVNGSNLSSATIIKLGGSGGTTISAANILSQTASAITFTIPNSATAGTVYVSDGTASATSSTSLTNLGYITAASTDYNTGGTWLGGALPTANAAITIANNITVNSAVANTAGSVLINASSGLTFGASGTLSLTSGATFINNGTSGLGGSGTITFLGSGTIAGSSSTTFNNLTLNGTTAFSTAPVIDGMLLLNSGSSVSGNSPTYVCSSLLKYNTGIGLMSRGVEWISGITSGAGYPGNVEISNNTGLNGNASGNNNLALCGGLTIDLGSALYMDYNSTGNATLTVGGNTLINGSLSLGYGTGGDLYMYGNLTVGATGVLNYVTTCNCPSNTGGSGRALQFIGAGTQIITYTGGGTLTIPIIDINKTSGNVQLATGTNILIPDYGSTNNSLQLVNGGLDLNGQTLTMYGSPNAAGYYTGILASNGVRTITGITGSTLAITAASFWPGVSAVSVNTASGGSLVTDVNVLVTTNVGFAPTSYTTINGTLQLNQLGATSTSNGFITDRNNYLYATSGGTTNISGHCIYGSTSTLIISDGGNFSRNIEWDATGIGTIGVTPGFPNNVIINNGTVYNIGDSTSTSGIADRAINGTLTIQSGDSLKMGTMDNGAHHFYVAGDVNISGTLQLATGATSSSPTAGDIYVGGNWIRNTGGVFDYNSANPRAVTFDNATSGTITAPASTGETFAYAYLSKTSTSAKIALADSVTILNQLGLNEGIFDLVNSNVTIVSGRYNTANIGAITTPANVSLPYSGSGRFVIERFFQAHRSWRLATVPISTALPVPTINQAWQEGAVNTSNTTGGIINPSPGYGTLITGPYNGTAGASFGFDPGTQPNPSIYYYNGSGWVCPANTNATNVDAYPGYLLFVRGSRNYIIGTQYTPADTTTLNPKGEINIGPQISSASAAGYKVIGNPYASGFNFHTTTKTGLSDIIYEWDAGLTGTNSVGAFVTLAWTGTHYSCAPIPVTPIDTLLGRVESGAAFFVKFTGSGNLTINESDKTSANNLVFRPASVNERASLRANLFAYNADSTVSLNDGVLTIFDPSFSNAVDDSDASKLTTAEENIALKRDGQLLAIELRQPVVPADSVFYNLSRLSTKNYRLQLIGSDMAQPGLIGYLVDTLLHTNTVINLDDTTNVNFSIPDAATATNSIGRFMVVFKQLSASPLPVTFTDIEASRQNNNSNNIIVKWEVSNELNLSYYEVEKSADGKNFFTIGTLKPAGNNGTNETYTWIDSSSYKGYNFYRIKSINTNGGFQYSNIVNVNMINEETEITINPNPVVNGILNVQLNNIPEGTYSLRVINANGQTIATRQIEYNNVSNTTVTINISNYLAAGLYNLEVINPDNNITDIPFITDKK